jgi:hypothetical protein
MSDIVVKPYPREGTPHRLYANLSFDEKAGEMNLRTGEVTIYASDRANEVATLLAQWCLRNPHLVAAAHAAKTRRRSSDLDGKDDLALNHPGEILLKRAAEERASDRRHSKRWALYMRALRVDSGMPYVKGAKGERRMARVLERMARRSTWRVLHSIPLPRGGDLDHLLIGTDGVVVVNTKYCHRARVNVGDRDVYINHARTDYLQDARKQAAAVAEILSKACGFDVRVTPCVAIFNEGPFAADIKRSGTPKDVIVATNWNIPRALWDVEDGLLDDQVEAIYEAARRPATWKK